MTKINIKLYISKKIIFIDNNNISLIKILESENIYVENQCREGFCGICRTKIIQGKVFYTKKPIAFINKNEILPCCCRLKKSIVIDL